MTTFHKPFLPIGEESLTFILSGYTYLNPVPFQPISFTGECADMVSKAAYQMGVTPEDLLETLKDGGLVNLFDLAAKKIEEKDPTPPPNPNLELIEYFNSFAPMEDRINLDWFKPETLIDKSFGKFYLNGRTISLGLSENHGMVLWGEGWTNEAIFSISFKKDLDYRKFKLRFTGFDKLIPKPDLRRIWEGLV